MNIKINKKLVEHVDHTKLTYPDKINIILHIYNYIKTLYGVILDVRYIYDITETSAILHFLLSIFRHLKDIYLNHVTEYETTLVQNTITRLRDLHKRPDNYISSVKQRTISKDIISQMDIPAILGAFLSRDARGNNRVCELQEIVIDEKPTLGTIPIDMQLKCDNIETGSATDRDFLYFGEYLQERKKRERHYTMIEGLNEQIQQYYEHLRSFMNTKMIKYSPLNNELSNLFVNMKKIINTIKSSSGTLYAHSQSMLSCEEIKYFHSISHYFDGNCRRNKKIINVYVIIKNMLHERITGWYQSKPITTYTLKILIKLVILFEQWPYRMNCIFQMMENYKDRLELLPDDADDIKLDYSDELLEDTIKSPEEWIELHRLSTLYSVFKHFPIELFNHSKLKYLSCMDYNAILFRKFMVEQQPIITIEYFYVCIGYIFNINYTVKDRIVMISNHTDMFVSTKIKIPKQLPKHM
jgi:hypothetical protein